MSILGIDYGERKLGVAISSGKLASPLKVIKYKTQLQALIQIREIIQKNNIERAVFGLSSGRIADETKEFAEVFNKTFHIPVEFEDETLTTKDAQRLAIEAGMNRTKRKNKEDAFSAALILQSYLDNL